MDAVMASMRHRLDHMGSTELAANLFRATQTEEKLRRVEHEKRRPKPVMPLFLP